MSQCEGKTPTGKRCRRRPKHGETFCPGHDPSKSAERQKISQRGGRAVQARWKEIEALAGKFPVWQSWEKAAMYAAAKHLEEERAGEKGYALAWYKQMLKAMECRDRKIDSERPIKIECTTLNLPRPTNGQSKGN